MIEYGRKPYISKTYREMMTRKTNAEVWQKIVESHSQFEKPYRSDNYNKMQHYHHAMPGLNLNDWDPDFYNTNWDFPFDPYDPSTWPWVVSFFCHSDPCYCADETRCVEVGCAYPIVGASLRRGCEGLSVEVVGTQICITANSNPSGTCRIDILMEVPPNKEGLPEGLQGTHGAILVDKCSNCEVCVPDATMAYDYNTSAETITREDSATVAITGLNTPFTWSVSGTGFTLDEAETVGLTNTLNADASACGSAEITVTGCDEVSVTGYVRCTTGTWSLISSVIDACYLAGEEATIEQLNPGQDPFTAEAIKGKYKQHNQYNPTGTYGNCADSQAMDCLLCADYCFNASWTRPCEGAYIGCRYIDPLYETAQKFVLADATAIYEWVCA